LKRNSGNLETDEKAPKSKENGSSELKTILNFIPKIIEVINGIAADLIPNALADFDRECKVDL
jgi:hypothetical protein